MQISQEKNLFVINIDDSKNVCYTVKNFNDENSVFVIDPVCCIDPQ